MQHHELARDDDREANREIDRDAQRAREILHGEPPAHPAQLTRFMTRLLDDAFQVPGTNFRMGLDPLLSIVPWAGSTVGTLFGGVMLVDAIRLRAPIPVLARMGGNYVIDWLLGMIPGIGWIGDAAWRSHRRNLKLLNRTIADREQVHQASLKYWITAAAIIVGILVLVLVTTIALIVWFVGKLSGA